MLDYDTILALIRARGKRYREQGEQTAETTCLALLRELEMANAVQREKRRIKQEQAMERED